VGGPLDGIIYLYHDQGNMGMKAAAFGEATLLPLQIGTQSSNRNDCREAVFERKKRGLYNTTYLLGHL
jgi:hypothetical protein